MVAYISGGGSYRKPPAVLAHWRMKSKQERRKRIERFAELLAEGYTISAAARDMGLTQQAGSRMFKTMQQELGEQAI